MKSAARRRHRKPKKIFEARPPPRGKRVLVVADDAMVCITLEDMLGELGYIIAAEAARIDGALEALRTDEFDARLHSRSCIIDGEAVACDDKGVASFDLVRYHRANERIFLYAFDLIELNGDDLRHDPLEGRKATLEMMLAKFGPGMRFNEHMEGDGETVFRHACKLGLEGIVSKRKDSSYRCGRSPDWLKMKNANAPAVKRRRKRTSRLIQSDCRV
jgi:CheY-like chemotaxis protein